MFDLTSNIKLNEKLKKRYDVLRISLHVFFLIGVLFVADRILFPSVSLDLFFNNLNSTKNTLVNPRSNNGETSKGEIAVGNKVIFNANPLGNFSSVKITLTTDKKSKDIENTPITVSKSYQAFFYPTGEPMGFKNGTLLTTEDGNYYIISNGTLRKFANTNIVLAFGFPKSSFILVEQKDLKFNTPGSDITTSNTYPDDSLFIINGTYYGLKGGQLTPFISERAYLSQFTADQAIAKNQDFLSSYPVAETSLGFANGTLASSAPSVFILSNGKSYPIANVNTFLAMGFSWDDVVALESEELGFYEQQKQFNDDQPHPDGTLFKDIKTNTLYVIENGKKRPILNEKIKRNYSNQKAILANLQDSEKKFSCGLKKQFLASNTYACTLPLDEMSTFLGNDYQIDAAPTNETKIDNINVIYSTPLSWENLKSSLSRIKENLKNNYNRQ